MKTIWHNRNFWRSGSAKCSKKRGGFLEMATEPILMALDVAEVQRRHGLARSSVSVRLLVANKAGSEFF